MILGIIPNVSKDSGLVITKEIIRWLLERNVTILLNDPIAEQLGMIELACHTDEMLSKSDIIVILGGDGTLLSVARQSSLYKVPLFGINLGHMGFLTETEVSDMYGSLEMLLAKQYTIEKRMMLEGSFKSDQNDSNKLHALNEIGITRGIFSRIISYSIYINDHYVDMYSADGLVVSTPTGSTAYSLSAGGPIVCPEIAVIVITPICPHTLHSRSIVVSNEDTVKIEICSGDTDVILTVDGQQGYQIKSGDTITIKQSPYYTNLVKLNHKNFFDLLRRKMSDRRNYKT